MHMRAVTSFLALLLAACVQAPAVANPPLVETTPAPATVRADAVIERAQSATAQRAAPAIVAVRDVVQAVVPLPVADESALVSPAAVAHIVRWEVTSAAHYTRRLQWPIWPGGASGITWGIGYDGGHQAARTITADWAAHPQVDRLARTAGITGTAARAVLPQYRDIVVPIGIAEQVFSDVSLPVYHRSTVRAYGDAVRGLPADARGALVGNTYNRGGSMVGSRNAEKRHIRDVCIPGGDLPCVAAQLRLQCRLWRGTNLEAGLCGRRESEAVLVERAR